MQYLTKKFNFMYSLVMKFFTFISIIFFLNICHAATLIDTSDNYYYNAQITKTDMQKLEKTNKFGIVIVSLRKLKDIDYKLIGLIFERKTRLYFGSDRFDHPKPNYDLRKRKWMPPPEYFEPEKKSEYGYIYEMGKIYSYPIEALEYESLDIRFRAGFKVEDLAPFLDVNYKYNFPEVHVQDKRVYLFEFFIDESTQYINVSLKDYSIEEYLTKIKNKDDEVLGILNKPPYNQLKTNVQNK